MRLESRTCWRIDLSSALCCGMGMGVERWKTDLHGFYGFVGFFDGIDLKPFGGVWKEKLVDDFDLAIGSSDGCHGSGIRHGSVISSRQ